MLEYLQFGIILYIIGLCGIYLNRKNLIILLMSVELMLFAINFSSICLSMYLDDIMGQILALLVLTVAASESSIGLAILVIYYRVRTTISVEEVNLMSD